MDSFNIAGNDDGQTDEIDEAILQHRMKSYENSAQAWEQYSPSPGRPLQQDQGHRYDVATLTTDAKAADQYEYPVICAVASKNSTTIRMA